VLKSVNSDQILVLPYLQKRWKPLMLLLKKKKRRKIVEHMSFMQSLLLRLLSMKGKIIEVALSLYNFKKDLGQAYLICNLLSCLQHS
jgi:hypothetical protein